MKAVLDIIRKNRKAQALLLALVALAALDAGFYFMRAAPEARRVEGLEERSGQFREDIRKKSDEYRVYYSFDRGRSEIDAFKSLLPARTDYISMLRRLIKLARQDGMRSEEFGAEKKAVRHEGDLSQISFTMPISGGYADVRKFIYDVESSDLFLNIDNLGLASKGDSDEITLTIGLSTYMRS